MKKDNDLTVMVFGKHREARTFTVSPSWFSRLGLLLCVMGVFSIISSGLAFRFYRQAALSEPWRVQELEQKLAEALDTQKNKTTTPTETSIPNTSTPHVPVAESHTTALTQNQKEILFTGLPVPAPRASPTELAIEVVDLKSEWGGKFLNVHFNLRYIKGDGGNQQGRILLLARGNSHVSVYPNGALNPADSSSLIAPEKGEYFSVSRFREVKARFGPAAHDEFQAVEILLLTTDGEILFHQTVKPQETKAAPPQSATPAQSPTSPQSTNTSPGSHP